MAPSRNNKQLITAEGYSVRVKRDEEVSKVSVPKGHTREIGVHSDEDRKALKSGQPGLH